MNEMQGKMKGNLQALFMIFVIVLKQRKVTMGFKQCHDHFTKMPVGAL